MEVRYVKFNPRIHNADNGVATRLTMPDRVAAYKRCQLNQFSWADGMIKSLFGLFSKQSHRPAVGKNPRSMPPRAAADFRAVGIDSSGTRCAAAKHAADMRFLMREAPRLPLADCTNKESCHCRFRKLPDRRSGDRRAFNGTESRMWYTGTESRGNGGRRQSEI